MRSSSTALLALSLAGVAALTGCTVPGMGGGDADRAVSFEGVQSATVQIEAVGTFVSPEEGGYEAAGRGSGFLVSSDGVVITNNHVVAGAGTLRVWVGGDDGRALNAELLGSSECMDLAVIKLQPGDYPHLAWREGAISTATDVYAAGFPLGDPTFTETRGIVSKASTSGETPWASIDSVIEHDARIRPGNSGGPLVDSAGRVIGVNYAGNDQYDTNLAIHRDAVLSVLDDLEQGIDPDSIGVNAQALTDADGAGIGVWASSVISGSPADRAGVEPGDLITRMAGVSVGVDGTMSEYCDVLRTQGQDATIELEVFRPSDGTYYSGQLNGTPLAQVAPLVPDAEAAPSTATGGEYTTVTDAAGSIRFDVPAEWSDVAESAYADAGGALWTDVTASPDIAAFRSSWTTPGVIVSASDTTAIPVSELLDTAAAELVSLQCVGSGRQPFQDGYHTGQYEVFDGCGGVGARYISLAAVADDGSYTITVNVQANTDEDLVAVDRIVNSFIAQF